MKSSQKNYFLQMFSHHNLANFLNTFEQFLMTRKLTSTILSMN